jgi:hypothetical protein
VRDEAGILPGCKAGPDASTTTEQEISGQRVPTLKIFVNRLAGLFGYLEPDRSTRLFLTNCRAFDRISVRCHVIDAKTDHVAPSEFAIDGEIEKRQIALASRHL